MSTRKKKEGKSAKGMHSDVAMREALRDVKNGMKMATSAKRYGVDRTTLRRYAKKFEDLDVIPDDVQLTSNFNHNQVFTDKQEQQLVDYLLLRSAIGYGMTASELRVGAYQFADLNKIKMHKNWEDKKEAGLEWYWAFMKRHPCLSARKPEQCSVARAACFNKVTIDNYFEKLEQTVQRHPNFINGSRKWNLDETGTSTVGSVKEKIISPKGQKQVHQIKGHERGTSVTTCCFVQAQGQTIPPVMIFPRVNFNKLMLVDAYPGTLGLANKAGYMTDKMFIPTIKHFIQHTKSCIEEPTLLMVDNFGAHLTLECINLCKDNGVTLFTLPPHTTHKTQPLDVGVFGPFSTAYDKAVQSWTLANPGIPPSIYQIAGFVNTAWSKSATPANIISAFKATGIHPLNKNIFSEKDFMPSIVTHINIQEPGPANQGEAGPANQDEAGPANEEDDDLAEQEIDNPLDVNEPANETNKAATTPTPSETASETSGHRTPLELFGLPKAKANPNKRAPRRKGRCMVATDSPEKREIEERELLKKQKQDGINQRKEARKQKQLEPKKTGKNTPKNAKSKKTAKNARRILFDGEDEEENPESSSEGEEEINFLPLTKEPEEGDYVLVEFAVAATEKKYYVGKILKEKDDEGDLQISYLRKSQKVATKYVLPQVPDLQSVHINDIKLLLPKPTTGGTRRQQNMLEFPGVKLAHLNMG